MIFRWATLYFLFLIGTVIGKALYIVPYPNTNTQVTFYNAKSSVFAEKWVRLREELERLGYEVKFTFDAANLDEDMVGIISMTNINPTLLANLKKLPKEKCWLFAFEPPVFSPSIYNRGLTEVFGKIFVMFDDLVDGKNYFKFYYPQSKQKMEEKIPDFSEKKLCVLIAANKNCTRPQELYSERLETISFFNRLNTGELDIYGHGWDGYENWKGVARLKTKVLEDYKFSICYENMKDQIGYITEKIFDCFIAGCVPIYWGASNIGDYVPKECFIDRRDFATHEDLYRFLKNMDRESYQKYLTAIRRYFSSPAANLFSIDNFLKIVRENIESDWKK